MPGSLEKPSVRLRLALLAPPTPEGSHHGALGVLTSRGTLGGNVEGQLLDYGGGTRSGT